jgi:heme/copper-type cytochrome/quinol oxidase subunit 4
VLALIFTALILFLFVAGTLWIMSDLNYRMM